MGNPNVIRQRGGKANRPSQIRHEEVRSEVSDIRSEATRYANPTITAVHCADAMRHADEVYIAEYADQGATETIVAGADDRSLTNALGIRFRKPEVELEPIPTWILNHEPCGPKCTTPCLLHGRMIMPLKLPNRLTWKTDSTLLNRGTFRRTETDKLRRVESRSKVSKSWRVQGADENDPAAVYIRDTPIPPEPEPTPVPSVHELAARLQAKFSK